MALPRQEDAEMKFWRTPELVERLMPFLDGQSTLALVKALPLALEVILRKSMWIKLVSQVCPYDTDDLLDEAEYEDAVANDRRQVMPLVEILKMVEDPNPLLLALLHVICERFPSGDQYVEGLGGPELIQVSCTCSRQHTSHTVSPYGFLLLEAVEGVLGSTEQKVERVVVHNLEELELTALQSRLFRQQDQVDPWGTPVGLDTNVEVSRLFCNSKDMAEAISTLLQYCHNVDVQDALFIPVDIGTEGWAALGKALYQNVVNAVVSKKADMASARREDLWAIWECATNGWDVWLDDNVREFFDDEWYLFEEFLDGEDDVNENEEEDVDEIEGEDGDEDSDA